MILEEKQSKQKENNKKNLLAYNTATGLKIGSAVGIMILLLGIAIFFGIHQMSLISQEVVEISEEYSPLSDIINDIKYQQQIQAINLEKIVRYDFEQNQIEVEKAKGEFWLSSGLINANIDSAKKISQAGIDISTDEGTKAEFLILQRQISDIEKSHIRYEESANKVFSITNESELENNILFKQIQTNELDLQDRLEIISKDISILTLDSINQIEENESNTLWGQFLIIIFVGAIAALLGLFLNQINNDLKNEVKVKTKDLQRANEKLKQLDKMKDEFIGIASHELRSPIQPIFGFAELAKSGDIDQDEAWSGVTQLAKKLQDLANDVLDVSRIDSNRLILHKEPVSINDLIIESVNEVKRSLVDRINIQTNLDENLQIDLDKVRIDQVLRNLLNNSLKFAPEGVIKLETHVNHETNNLHIIISDSGSGISDEILPKIFDKFVTKGTHKLNPSGTGLGLFLCKGIVEAHHGKIFARNNPDKGATFEFTIPIIDKIKENELMLNKV